MIQLLVGLLTGVLSSWGLGGGTLLLIYLTNATTLPQPLAQSANLLFFLATGIFALPNHLKSGNIQKDVTKHAIKSGIWGCLLGTLLAQHLETQLLKKGFSALLILLALYTLFKKEPPATGTSPENTLNSSPH